MGKEVLRVTGTLRLPGDGDSAGVGGMEAGSLGG